MFGLDAATGEALWRTVGTNISYGEGMAGNGLVVGNLFIVGNEGGERGARGKVHAYDINTGNLQWMMYNMGPDNEVGITPALPGLLPRQPDLARHLVRRLLASWRRHLVGLLHLGSPTINIFYYSTGNCGPWNPDYRREWGVVNLDDNGGLIDYRNNWCASQMARDATTGNLVWAFNITPADHVGPRRAADHPAHRRSRSAASSASSRSRRPATATSSSGIALTGELVIEPWPFTSTSTHITGVDMETGRALYNIDKWHFTNLEDRRRYTQVDPGRRADGTRVADYTGTEIDGARASLPATGRTTPTRRGPASSTPRPRPAARRRSCSRASTRRVRATRSAAAPAAPPTPIARPSIGTADPRTAAQLQANDPIAGANRLAASAGRVGNNVPLMATATDLLFQVGVNNGTFRALDATNGDIVWEFRTGARGNATPMTYLDRRPSVRRRSSPRRPPPTAPWRSMRRRTTPTATAARARHSTCSACRRRLPATRQISGSNAGSDRQLRSANGGRAAFPRFCFAPAPFRAMSARTEVGGSGPHYSRKRA